MRASTCGQEWDQAKADHDQVPPPHTQSLINLWIELQFSARSSEPLTLGSSQPIYVSFQNHIDMEIAGIMALSSTCGPLQKKQLHGGKRLQGLRSEKHETVIGVCQAYLQTSHGPDTTGHSVSMFGLQTKLNLKDHEQIQSKGPLNIEI